MPFLLGKLQGTGQENFWRYLLWLIQNKVTSILTQKKSAHFLQKKFPVILLSGWIQKIKEKYYGFPWNAKTGECCLRLFKKITDCKLRSCKFKLKVLQWSGEGQLCSKGIYNNCPRVISAKLLGVGKKIMNLY